MKKITISIIVVSLLFIIGGCCGTKSMSKKAELMKQNVTVNTNPLEMHAGKVKVDVHVNFPEKFFCKKGYVVVTPTLVSKKDETIKHEFASETLQGEKINDNNPVVIYKTGDIKYGPNEKDIRTDTTFTFVMDYDPDYRMSDLNFDIKIKKGTDGELKELSSDVIAEGIITTPELVDKGLIVDNGKQGNTGSGLARTIEASVVLPAETTVKEDITLFYEVKKTNFTAKEKKREDIETFVEEVKTSKEDKDKEFVSFSILSYASPEGEIDMNEDLVEGRGKNTQNFLSKELKDAEVDGADEDNFYTRETTPAEDWEGFKTKVQASNIEDKELILRVLEMQKDLVKREEEIKKIGSVYDEIDDKIFPELRRSEVYATFKTKQKPASELVILGKSNPDELTQTELFFAAQSAEGTDKETIYKTYITKYPKDWRAMNNLGVYYIKANQLNDAETYLQKAENIESNNATIINNFGVLQWAKENLSSAQTYFKKAKAIEDTDEISYNIGVLQIKEAKYQEAVTSFGQMASFNKALAQLLSGNTADAKTTLNNVKSEDANYYYLKAVISARESNNEGIFTNLQKAVQADASLKAYAMNDMEFAKVFDDETFKSIVK